MKIASTAFQIPYVDVADQTTTKSRRTVEIHTYCHRYESKLLLIQDIGGIKLNIRISSMMNSP